jgi:beta-lactamase regulating signal transducer with metallopeptidase domain
MTDVHALSEWIAGRLLDGSVQAVLIIGLVWLVCRRVTSMPPSVQAMLWWMASLKLVLALLAIPTLPLPVLPAESVDSPPMAPVPVVAATVADVTPEWPAGEISVDGGAGSPSTPDPVPWVVLLAGVWLLCMTAQAWRLLHSLRRLRGIVQRSTPLVEGDAADLAARLAGLLGLAYVPEVRASDEIDAPQVVGLRRPVILFPAAMTLAPDERAMALCHELMHVRRRDLAMGWVPALAERLFFFHPMARFAAREYVVAREAACDAAVVRALDVAPTDYGRLLLRFGVARSEPAFSAGGSSPSISSLRRRLDMLHHTAFGGGARRSTWLIAVVMALALLPFQLVARTPDASPVDARRAALAAPAVLAVPSLEAVPAPPQVEGQAIDERERRDLEARLLAERALEEALRDEQAALEKAIKAADIANVIPRQTKAFLQEELAQAAQAHEDLLRKVEQAHAAQRLAAAQAERSDSANVITRQTQAFLQEQLAQAAQEHEDLLRKVEQAHAAELLAAAQAEAERLNLIEVRNAQVRQGLARIEEQKAGNADAARADLLALQAQLAEVQNRTSSDERLLEVQRLLAELREQKNQKVFELSQEKKQKVTELLEAKAAKGSTKLGPPQSLEAQARTLAAQLERLARSQEQLVQQQEQLRRAQEQLITAQKQLADQAERLRQAMEKSQAK